MPRGVRKETTTPSPSTPSLSEQIADNERQILETEKQLANLRETRMMLLDLKDKSDFNDLFTFVKSSGLSIEDLKNKLTT